MMKRIPIGTLAPSDAPAPERLRVSVRTLSRRAAVAGSPIERAAAERDRARTEIAKAMAAMMSLWLNEPSPRQRARLRVELDRLAERQTAIMAVDLALSLDRPEIAAALETLRANNEELARAVAAMDKAVDTLARAAMILKLADKAIKLLGRLTIL